MKHILSIILLFSFLSTSIGAQERMQQAEALFQRFKATAAFDYRYPREKVYVHFDNSGYMENDTIWYKAYVVRASSLTPTNLSRVLYTELLNADGQLIEQQILRIDSLGQANGCFALKLPVRAGFYEVRAFTREMTNWGETACFSRVLPVFAAKQKEKKDVAGGNYNTEELEIPMPQARKKPSLGEPRPYELEENTQRTLSFYPEGGWRGKGLSQQVAFSLLDGRGHAVDDTLQIFSDDGQLVAETVAEHEGMGSFRLPADVGRGYAQLKGRSRRWELPEPMADFVLHAEPSDSGITVELTANAAGEATGSLLGLAVMNRERVCFFDTLAATQQGVETFIPLRALRGGVNRIEIFDTDGRSLATRLAWCAPKPTEGRNLHMVVRQNKAEYGAFEPAVLSLELKDAQGQPVRTTVSLAVRDRSGNMVTDSDPGLQAEMLLASELRGFIAQPQAYFLRNDAAHRRMTDLLMMVQGWTANAFSVMCDADTFRLRQPIEEHLILRGALIKGVGKKREPQADCRLSLKMYSLAGGALEGVTRTDKDGKFVFQSAVDYAGPYIAQFTATDNNGKRRWNRLTLDRWFAPTPRAFCGQELDIHPYLPDTLTENPTDEPLTFEWEDTIPRRIPTVLGEAKVTSQSRYKGFTGTRYSWLGGEKAGMRHAMRFYNIEREAERAKDLGMDPGSIWDFLNQINSEYNLSYWDAWEGNSLTTDQNESEGQGQSSTSIGITPSEQKGRETAMEWKGKEIKVYVNNEPLSELKDRFPEYYTHLEADAVKSVSVVTDGVAEDALSGATTNRSKGRYSMYIYELPKFYRTHTRLKGVERRNVYGFTQPTAFYSPDYRSFDIPSSRDVRRTLLWAPSVQTDAEGRASVIFYTNSRETQRLDVTVRGVTQQGQLVE